ncbi:MAG: hypothetical protein N3A66_12200, partial [Planctomycetota bacterium]|nr:hypothetical protein [Planctomycetota bacterium]
MPALFSPQHIAETLRRFRRFWRGESQEPLVSIYHEPKYRQQPDEEKMVAEAAAAISADAASGEED